MSTTVQEGNREEKSQLLALEVDELGITKSRSMVHSVISADEKDKIAENFDPSSCLGCRLIMERKNELKEQRLELKQTVLEHKQLEHGSAISEDKTKKPTGRDPPRDNLELFKNIKYTGNLYPLSNRFVDPKAIVNGVQPPMQPVKRLKGDLAKSVGNKIDGCDWLMFHPYGDVSLPEKLNKDGGLKQA